MAEILTGKTIWNEASKAGLALGGLSVGCALLSGLMAHMGDSTMVKFFISVFGFIIWAAKFGGCIWLMAYFMKKLVADYEDVTNHDTYILGVESALLSALIVAGYTLASTMLVSPETYKETFEIALSQYSGMIDSNSREALDSMIDNMPVIMFVSNLIYCFIYGWVLSGILSRNIPSSNPFERQTPTQAE